MFGSEGNAGLVEGKIMAQVVVLGGCREAFPVEETKGGEDEDGGDGDEDEGKTSDKQVVDPNASLCSSMEEIYILTITVGADDDDSAYSAASGGNNGFLWNWSHVATLPPMGSDGPSPRLWFGAAFGELLLSGLPPARSERMQMASLKLSAIRRRKCSFGFFLVNIL